MKLEKEMKQKEFQKLIQKFRQRTGVYSNDKDDHHNHPESKHRPSIRKRRVNGELPNYLLIHMQPLRHLW